MSDCHLAELEALEEFPMEVHQQKYAVVGAEEEELSPAFIEAEDRAVLLKIIEQEEQGPDFAKLA